MTDLPLENRYLRLGEPFYRKVMPTPVARPELLAFNRPLARELGLESLEGEAGVALLSGNHVPPGLTPIALAYAGHQFGNFVPSLGDGRALLLGELAGERGPVALQLKGSGPTPFSRGGDGRAALGPVLREYLVSEAMAALAIPTTRALAAVATGETVVRQRPHPGAILTRLASGFTRVGTFQYFAFRKNHDALRRLTDHVIDTHYPELAEAQAHERPLRLLDAVVERQADLVARWMAVGFIHGVMNTDNMAISGETLDYGPCAFMDRYRHDQLFSAIDTVGRYAYGNQPVVAQWNLARLAETLLPLIDRHPERALKLAEPIVLDFTARYRRHWLARMGAKIGLEKVEEKDETLIETLLEAMERGGADFTLAFRRLSALEREPGPADAAFTGLFEMGAGIEPWLQRWRNRLERERGDDPTRRARMEAVNPAIIPRNHRIEEVIAAAEAGDLAPFHTLDEALRRPFDPAPAHRHLMAPPGPGEEVRQTFCGT